LTLLPDGLIVEANRTFLSWVERDADDVLRRTRLSELLSVGGRIYWETHLSPLLLVEGRVDEVALELKSPEGRLPVLLSAEADTSSDLDGGVVFRVAISSARERSRYERELRAAREWAERSEARVRLLQSTTAKLSEALGVSAVVDALVSAVLGPLGAAAATVWLTSTENGLTVQAAGGDDPRPEGLPPGLLLHDSVAVEHEGRLVVPLHGQTELRGVLSVTGPTSAGAEPLDLEVLTAIGQQAGLALDRAQLYEQSAGVARELQHSLLAMEPPADRRYAVATTYRPGVAMLEVGGDWYDVFLADDGVLSIVIGDVVGRGLRAASAMGQLRSAVRAVADGQIGPARLLMRIDHFVEQVEAATMATVVYAELDLAGGGLRYSCAGHPPPLLLPTTGQPRFLSGGRAPPLGGFFEAPQRPEAALRFEPGDRLLLYTDGLVERRDRDLDAGLDLLRATAERMRDLPLEEAVRSLTDFMLQDEVVRDDVCVLLLAWSG
jgi:hypothetical protein